MSSSTNYMDYIVTNNRNKPQFSFLEEVQNNTSLYRFVSSRENTYKFMPKINIDFCAICSYKSNKTCFTVQVCNVPDLASLGNPANVCVGSMVYNI
jgi:hypothetical protein